jgi:SAM-dependent methyltransferase
MSSPSASPIDIDVLMAQIRAEAARRRSGAPMPEADHEQFATTGPQVLVAALNPLPMPSSLDARFVSAERYHLNNFLALHDADFIEAAYRGILKRGADPEGYNYFLTSLRSGRLGKIEVLGRLRYSREGKCNAVHIRGLLPAFATQHACRLPVIGSVLAYMVALLRLPRFARVLQGFENYQHYRNAENQSTLGSLAQTVEGNERLLANRVVQAEARSAALEMRLATVDGRFAEIDQRLVDTIELAQKSSTQLASTLCDTLTSLDRRVEALDGALRGEPGGSRSAYLRLVERIARVEGRVHEQSLRTTGDARSPSVPMQDRSTRFDRLYFAFERRFRGSREDIRQRLSYYLPLLRESVVGGEDAVVLDIGCGRGEWLELLRDENIRARGIDINETMAAECVGHGLAVEVGDVMAYLKRLPDNALGALTGFHIIEHIAFETLLELIDEAHRVVQPGGLVIFETPNPENVVVGACNFYIDPTHQRPLPPVLTQFLVESGGFVDVAIHRVNANLLPNLFDEPAESDPSALRSALACLHSIFSCAPDYSVVGRVA